jgi:hypothetical protein
MIELKHDALAFSFPEVHPDARLSIDFQRTLRIPDDDRTYPLPPGLGRFALRHVDDFAKTVPAAWLEHGGVMLPMYQSEALWLNFDGHWSETRGTVYPFAVKVATGKIDAVTGQDYTSGVHRRPQDYVVVPGQPWLDGYCVEKGIIRQFVAMPLGAGYSAEEQITGEAAFGGLQLAAYPMKREVFERRFPKRAPTRMRASWREELCMAAPPPAAGADMGLAPGGRMHQEIEADAFDLHDWDVNAGSRCFVHLANSLVWQALTGQPPPTPPPTAKAYTDAGLPWFDHYVEGEALEGSNVLAALKSVLAMGRQKGDVPLPENESLSPERVILLRRRLSKDQVREGAF